MVSHNPHRYKLFPALGGFLGRQLGLLLFLFLFELLLFLLVGFVFILLAAFFSHCMPPYLWNPQPGIAAINTIIADLVAVRMNRCGLQMVG